MKEFIRSEELNIKMAIDSLIGIVVPDVEIIFTRSGSSLKAYAPALDAYLQFPKKLRDVNETYICDCVKRESSKTPYYHAYKNSIRTKDGEVVG